jgi:hypothetical protein
MSKFSNIDPVALDNVSGGLVTSRSSTNDQLLLTLNSLSSQIQANANNNNNGFNNPTTMLMFALLASKQQQNSTTVVSSGYRPFWW